MSDDRKPTLQKIIDDAVLAVQRSTYKMVPAKVVKWSDGRADCQILVKRVYEDEDGVRQVTSWPVVTGCPVMFMGAGGFRVTFPISDGTSGESTTGMLMFSHASLDKWLASKTPTREVDPELDHDHALNDAVFIPGLRSFGDPWTPHASKLSIGNDGDASDIEIDTSGNVVISSGDKGAARVDDPCQISPILPSGPLATWMGQVEAAINVIAPGTVTPLSATFLSSPGITIKTGSTKVKVG
jgi:hypothetical protein